jgi:hypothetical protein
VGSDQREVGEERRTENGTETGESRTSLLQSCCQDEVVLHMQIDEQETDRGRSSIPNRALDTDTLLRGDPGGRAVGDTAVIHLHPAAGD